MTFDGLRAAHPSLGFALYAYEPGDAVTLEIHADGGVFTFIGATCVAAIDAAFPPAPPVAATPADDVFG